MEGIDDTQFLEDKLQRHNLTTDDLKRCCSRNHAIEIAKNFSQWRDASSYLELSQDDVQLIERDHQDEASKRRACLEKWMELKGDNATYLMLLKALHFCNRMDLIDSLLKLIEKVHPDDGLDSDSSGEVKDEDMRFLCGCGECTIDSFVKNGCPHPWDKVNFPLLDIKKLKRPEKIALLARLTEETDTVSSKFASLTRRTYVALKDTDVKELVIFLLLQQKLMYMEDEERRKFKSDLQAAPSVADVVILLEENLISWFNHPLLGSITREFRVCEEDYKTYVEKVFTPFIKRSLFEVPSTSLNPIGQPRSGKFFLKVEVPKMRPKGSLKADLLLPLRRHVSSVLGIAIDAFDLCSYEKGCLQLTIAAPLVLLQAIFPIPDSVLNLLSEFCHEKVQIKSIAFEQNHHTVPKKAEELQDNCVSKSKSLTNLMGMFASLIVELYRSIKNSNVSQIKEDLLHYNVFKLRASVQLKALLHGVQDELQDTSTVADLLLILNSFWSFYNCELLAKIIRKYGSEEAKRKYTLYLDFLYNAFRVADLPPLIQPFAIESSYHPELLVLETKGDILSFSVDLLHEIQKRMATLLNMEPYTVLLKRIKKGSNQLEFLVPNCVSVIFNKSSLQELPVSKVFFGGKCIIDCCECKGSDSESDSGFISDLRSSSDASSSSYDACSSSNETYSSNCQKKSKKKKRAEKTSQEELVQESSLTCKDTVVLQDAISDSAPAKLSPPVTPTKHHYNPNVDPFVPAIVQQGGRGATYDPEAWLLDPTFGAPYLPFDQSGFTVPDLSQVMWPNPAAFAATFGPEGYPVLVQSAMPLLHDPTVYMNPNLAVPPSDHKRLTTFKEMETWKTNFQLRLSNTALDETEVEADLTVANYRDKFYYLLCYEESAHIQILTERCDGKYSFSFTGTSGRIQGMSDDTIQYATQASEAVFLLDAVSKEEICKALILPVNFQSVHEDFLIPLSPSAVAALKRKLRVQEKDNFEIYAEFEVKHNYFDALHEAVVKIPQSMIRKILPMLKDVKDHSSAAASKVHSECPHKVLNIDEFGQLRALEVMLQSSPNFPVIVSGPFGSGKTRLLARATYEFIESGLKEKDPTRILICAHHYSTLDTMTNTLDLVFRSKRHPGVKIIKILRNTDWKESQNVLYTSVGGFEADVKKHIANHILVVITTYTSSLKVAQALSSHKFHFTHILLDEAAQVREPEAIAALSLGNVNTKVIITGDSKQDGPSVVVMGDIARNNGLKISLLERLERKYDDVQGRLPLVQLNMNYRCHPALTKFLASTIYRYPIESAFTPSKGHSKAKDFPCYFYCSHIKDDEEDYKKPLEVEADAILEQLNEFFDPESDKDICIVSSFKAQLNLIEKKLRFVRGSKFRHVSLKPTYMIQGHEYQAVLLSTHEPLECDGSSSNRTKTLVEPGIFNTAVSRSKQLVIAVGNPFRLLRTEEIMQTSPRCWREYIKLCVQNDTVIYSKDLDKPQLHSTLEAQVGISKSPPQRSQSGTTDIKIKAPSVSRSLSQPPETESPSLQKKEKKSRRKSTTDNTKITSKRQKQKQQETKCTTATLQPSDHSSDQSMIESSPSKTSLPQTSPPQSLPLSPLRHTPSPPSKLLQYSSTSPSKEEEQTYTEYRKPELHDSPAKSKKGKNKKSGKKPSVTRLDIPYRHSLSAPAEQTIVEEQVSMTKKKATHFATPCTSYAAAVKQPKETERPKKSVTK